MKKFKKLCGGAEKRVSNFINEYFKPGDQFSIIDDDGRRIVGNFYSVEIINFYYEDHIETDIVINYTINNQQKSFCFLGSDCNLIVDENEKEIRIEVKNDSEL